MRLINEKHVLNKVSVNRNIYRTHMKICIDHVMKML